MRCVLALSQAHLALHPKTCPQPPIPDTHPPTHPPAASGKRHTCS